MLGQHIFVIFTNLSRYCKVDFKWPFYMWKNTGETRNVHFVCNLIDGCIRKFYWTGKVTQQNISRRCILPLVLSCRVFLPYMTRVTRKQTLTSLLLSYQKKDGRAWPRLSFFWYNTDFFRIWVFWLHSAYSLKVGVIPKEGWARMATLILLLVWHRLCRILSLLIW